MTNLLELTNRLATRPPRPLRPNPAPPEYVMRLTAHLDELARKRRPLAREVLRTLRERPDFPRTVPQIVRSWGDELVDGIHEAVALCLSDLRREGLVDAVMIHVVDRDSSGWSLAFRVRGAE